jgi:hypothetical protein
MLALITSVRIPQTVCPKSQKSGVNDKHLYLAGSWGGFLLCQSFCVTECRIEEVNIKRD